MQEGSDKQASVLGWYRVSVNDLCHTISHCVWVLAAAQFVLVVHGNEGIFK
jgi:hypothetical protein